jgi:hypothetical protein
MKTKLTTLTILLCATCTAQAHLINLTPGGWSSDEPLPDAFFILVRQTFFDSAARGVFQLPGEQPRFFNEWISRFGRLKGADWFGTSLFDGDAPFASVSWNMTGQPDGFYVNMIYVVGQTNDGELWQHLYGVSQDQHFIGEGIVTANGLATIRQIAFYGRVRASDTGTTLMLFGLALATLWWATSANPFK